MKQHAWLRMPFPWRFDMSAEWIYQRVSSKPSSLKGTFLRTSICTMIQWNFPDSKYSVLVTSDLNTIGRYIFQEKIYQPREEVLSARQPASQGTTTTRLSRRRTSRPTAVKPIFVQGTFRYRSTWAPDDQQPHQDFRAVWRKQDAMPICAVRKSVKAISENAFFGSVSLESENPKDFYSLPH